MNKLIKTTNNQWKHRFFVLLGCFILFFLFFIIMVTRTEFKKLKENVTKLYEIDKYMEMGRESITNYIISNEKYPMRFKKNTIWVKKEELCGLE